MVLVLVSTVDDLLDFPGQNRILPVDLLGPFADKVFGFVFVNVDLVKLDATFVHSLHILEVVL